MPKDAFYFKHDANASSDLKLKAIRKHYGWQGCGWFWFLIELMRSEENYELEYSQLTFDALSDDMGCPPDKVKEYIDYCATVKLFEKNSTHFSSLRLCRDMEVVDTAREQRRKAGIRSAEVRLTSSTRSTDAERSLNTRSTRRRDKKREEKEDNTIDNKMPDWLNKETWDAFLEMRKIKKAIPTENAKVLLIRELEKLRLAGDDPNEILNRSIMNSWKGVFSLKGGQNATHRRNSTKLPTKYTEPPPDPELQASIEADRRNGTIS